ncbi:spore germination protein YaaH [Scopulibacillus daqui]|uniref:Spore germination protein YaaH n=1 Tax=Scopulibacillus daqui TaxID=1469162 RepID=A0ABS2Q0E1_9BACL|nr:glycosyl hydrolase family 18 protein [Scopulibacillus daqui]MBM7645768.1 spore germination protein YaaH [Scopulibacillus daqui]
MFVYTVKPGDSLYSISQKYQYPLNNLRMVNGLHRDNITPGQALLIPSRSYTVQQGDSFYSIAKRAYISADELLRANPGVDPNQLQPGMRVNIPEISKEYITTFGYTVVRGLPSDIKQIEDFAPYTSLMALFEYHFYSNGSLSQLNVSAEVAAAWRNHMTPLATITNLTPQGFSSSLTHQVLSNPSATERLINNIYQLVTTNGFGGVNIDFEKVLAEDRELFSSFLRRLNQRLKERNLITTISVPPKENDNIPWLKGYDYQAIGSAVDYMFIMAYDWHYPGSEPGPVAPIGEIRKTLDFAVSKVRRDKIILGVPYYGYDWIIPYRPGQLPVTLSAHAATTVAMNNNVPIQYSEEYKSPFFYYTDTSNRRHVVWFEDARSLIEKALLVRKYRLGGFGAWELSFGLPQGSWILTRFFRVRKV